MQSTLWLSILVGYILGAVAAALVLPNGREHLVEGRQAGRILRQRRGEGGFGYDPIFLGDGQTQTNAELTAAEKDAMRLRRGGGPPAPQPARPDKP